jgi:hypothetical protein
MPTPVRFVDVCPECAYSLAGSPEEGICPECGAAYDQRVMILHGSAMGSHATLDNGSPRALGCLAVYGIFQLLAFWPRINGVRSDLFALALCAVMVGWAATRFAARWSKARPGLIQVYLAESGCLQVDNPGDGRAGPGQDVFMSLMTLVFLLWGLSALAGQIGWPRALAAAGLVLAFLAPALYFWRRNRASRQGTTPKPAVARADRIVGEGRPWAQIGDVSLERGAPGFFRLRIRVDRQKAGYAKETVDAELPMDFARAGEIRAQIEAWRCAARATTSAAVSR